MWIRCENDHCLTNIANVELGHSMRHSYICTLNLFEILLESLFELTEQSTDIADYISQFNCCVFVFIRSNELNNHNNNKHFCEKIVQRNSQKRYHRKHIGIFEINILGGAN